MKQRLKLQQGRVQLDAWKILLIVRLVKNWNWLPREAVEPPSSGIFETGLVKQPNLSLNVALQCVRSQIRSPILLPSKLSFPTVDRDARCMQDAPFCWTAVKVVTLGSVYVKEKTNQILLNLTVKISILISLGHKKLKELCISV